MYFDDISCFYCIDYLRKSIPYTVAFFSPDKEFIGCTSPALTDHTCLAFQYFETFESNGKRLCYIGIKETPVPDPVIAYIHAVINCAVEQNVLREQFEPDMNEQVYFINQLISTEQAVEDDLDSMAIQLKFNPDHARCAAFFSAKKSLTSADFSLDRNKRLLYWILTIGDDSNSEDIFGVLNTQEFIVFKSCPSVDDEEAYLKAFAARIISEVKNYCGVDLIAGVGSIYETIAHMHSSYQEALFMASNHDFFSSPKERNIHLVNRHIFEYLYSTLGQTYLEQKLKPYREMISKNHVLDETLITISANHMNLRSAANKLGIHRNTMLQRFSHIKECLDINPLYCDKDRMMMRQLSLYCNQKTTLNIGICIQDGSALHEWCHKFSELLTHKSNGSLNCKSHTVLLSGNNHVLLELLRGGSLDFAISDSYSLMAYTEEKIQVLYLPFLFDSAEESDFIMEGSVGQEFSQMMEHHGFINLMYISTGFRHISTCSGFVSSPQDLKGLRIRIMHKEIMERYFKLMGATPVMAGYSDIYPMLKKGIIDSQENPHANFLAMKFYEYQPYVSEWSLSYGTGCLVTTPAALKKLSEHQQHIVYTAIQEVKEWYKHFLTKFNEDSKYTLITQHGVSVFPIGKQPLDLWRASAKPLYDDYPDQELLKRIWVEKRRYYEKKSHSSV